MRYSLVIPVAPERNVEVEDSIAGLDYPKDRIEVIIERGTNPSRNRNRGVKGSKGDIIVFLDDEVHFDKDFLTKADRFFQNYTNYDILGGPQLTPENDTFFGKMSGMALASFFGTFTVSNRYKKGSINLEATEFDITSANCFIKREVFEKIGYLHLFLYPAEEREFYSRAQAAGFKIAKSPGVAVYHHRRSNLWSLAKQTFGYGVTRPQKEIIARGKLYLELEFILAGLFSIYVTFLPLLFTLWKLFIIPFFVYLLFIIAGTIVESITNRSLAGLILFPVLFFTIHYSYGWGLARGFIKALFLWKNRKGRR